MPLHIIHRSSSLYLACLRTSLNRLCFSWALCSANWILPLSKALSFFLPSSPTIIDFLKGFLENTIQVMWLVWTRQSPFELAPWQYLCLSWFENFRQWFGRFARCQHHLRQQRWLLQLVFLSFSSAQPLVSWFPHNLSSWRTIPQNRLSLPTFSMIWTICNWASY